MRLARIALGSLTLCVATLVASPALAGDLSSACHQLEEQDLTSCTLEQPRQQPWQLTTRLVVGTGRKAAVSRVEESFCDAARRRGVVAHVTRWSQLGLTSAQGARIDWSCGLPSVSAAPRR